MMLLSDWKVNHEWKSRLVLVFFRLANLFVCGRGKTCLMWWFGVPLVVIYRILIEWVFGIELPPKTRVGAGLKLRHGQGLVVHPGARIGDNVTLRHHTTIGNKTHADGSASKAPVIGNNVDVGCHVVIIGPVTIGDNAVIGAGSVVVKDVPPDSIVAGNPARILGSA